MLDERFMEKPRRCLVCGKKTNRWAISFLIGHEPGFPYPICEEDIEGEQFSAANHVILLTLTDEKRRADEKTG